MNNFVEICNVRAIEEVGSIKKKIRLKIMNNYIKFLVEGGYLDCIFRDFQSEAESWV